MTMFYSPDLSDGCDHWTGARYCAREATFEDEVTTQRFCQLHAGPLSWNDHDVDVCSMALRICGEYDTPCPLPSYGRVA